MVPSFFAEMHLERISDLYSLGDKEPVRILNITLTRGTVMKTEFKVTLTGAKAWLAAGGLVAVAGVITYIAVGSKK